MARIRGTGVALSLVLLASCHGSRNGDDTTETSGAVVTPSPAITLTATITTPHLISPMAVALGATGSIMIGGATKITRPGTAFSVITNMGTGGVNAEPDGLLGEVRSQSTVTLKDRVHALGKVFAPNVVRGNSVLIDGGVDSTTALVPATITSWPVKYPSAVVANVVVPVNGTATAAPGRFGAFQLFSGAKLNLSAGTYYLDTLDLEPQATLVLNQDAGPVIIYVRNSQAILRGAISTTSGAAPDLLLGYLATTDLIVEMKFVGTIVAPTAKVVLRSITGGHTGAFFGKDIEVGPNTTVSFRPGHAILSAQPPGTFDSCAAAVQPNDSLSGSARDLQFQRDILRFCTGGGIPACEQTIRARMNTDFFLAAASVLTNRMTTARYQQVLKDRDAKLKAFRKNPTLACDVVAHDGDGDYVPDSADACRNTPPLTPVLPNGCTNTNLPPGPDPAAVQGVVTYLGVNVDPRCANAPQPAVPNPLAAWRTADESLGKAIWISRDPGVTTCPLYYQVEVSLTDGSKPRAITFRDTENTTLPWIERPAGAVQFSIHSTDDGNRGAWANYSVFTRTFRVRAYNLAGKASEWSEYFSFGTQDCVAGQTCPDL